MEPGRFSPRSAKTDTAIAALIQRSLAAVGQAQETEITAFTDGCSGLRSILVDAGVTAPPYLDWFHIAMRLQHAEKTAGSLPTDTPEREHARAVIVTEVDRLHWRIWNGKAKDAQITLERIRDVMPVFQGEGGRKEDPAWRRLWTALREIDRYLSNQSAWLVNYAERHRAGLRVGTVADRSNRQLPGQPPHEQVPADALVPTRCRSPAPGSLRRPQRQTRLRLRTALQSQSRLRNGYGCLTPIPLTVPSR